jgi:uncharacterized protein (TIGR01777 family)
MTKILISGGSGLLGSNLTQFLQLGGHEVAWLSRNPKGMKQQSFYWNPEKGEIDIACLKGVSTIINLAGAGVADKRWTSAYKSEILNSRIEATSLLFKTLQDNVHQVGLFIGASAVGIYGNNPPKNCKEESPLGDTFLAEVCKAWENESLRVANLGIQTSIIRIGIVLSEKGGFIKEIAKPAYWGFGAALGNGKMTTPWIHIHDLSKMFAFLIENQKYQGVFNGVAPQPASNQDLTTLICKAIHRPQWLPPIPSFVLRPMLGEITPMLLANQDISCTKILEAGFQFQYPTAEQAINDLLK